MGLPMGKEGEEGGGCSAIMREGLGFSSTLHNMRQDMQLTNTDLVGDDLTTQFLYGTGSSR